MYYLQLLCRLCLLLCRLDLATIGLKVKTPLLLCWRSHELHHHHVKGAQAEGSHDDGAAGEPAIWGTDKQVTTAPAQPLEAEASGRMCIAPLHVPLNHQRGWERCHADPSV